MQQKWLPENNRDTGDEDIEGAAERKNVDTPDDECQDGEQGRSSLNTEHALCKAFSQFCTIPETKVGFWGVTSHLSGREGS